MTDTTHAPGCCDRRLAVDDLIERLRAVKWEEVYDDDRMPDDPTHKCVLVDMRPDDFRALLREAAAEIEALRAEIERLAEMLRELERVQETGAEGEQQ